MMRPNYSSWFGAFSRSGLKLHSVPAAILAYLFIIVGFVMLVLARQDITWKKGAIFGLAVYGVYNMTNLATLPGYPWMMALIDTMWGVVIFATLPIIYSYLARTPAHRR